jgi:hypothetical protein
MATRDSVSMEEIGKRALAVATKKPLTAAELAEKMTKRHPKNHRFTARGIGRGLRRLVQTKSLVKTDDRVPRYYKPA